MVRLSSDEKIYPGLDIITKTNSCPIPCGVVLLRNNEIKGQICKKTAMEENVVITVTIKPVECSSEAAIQPFI